MDFLNALPGAITQGLIWGIMAIGLYITYKVLNLSDLTVDGSFATGACVCTILMISGVNAIFAIILAFISGILAGVITAIFHTFMGIPAILSGILTQLILWSLNLKILGSANKSLSSRNYKVLMTQLNIGSSIIVVILITIAVIGLLYWFFGTELGCSIRATGNNEAMSRAQGINTNLNKFIGLGLSNGLVALSGALLCQYQGFADINMGRGAIVIGLAAIIIGSLVIKLFTKNFAFCLFGCSLGGIIYYIVYQFVINLGFDTDLLKLLSAVVVAIFLAIPYWKNKYFNNQNKKVKEAK